MYIKSKIALILVLLTLASCKPKTFQVPLGEVSLDNPAETVRIREGTMLLRGLDKERLDTDKVPNPFSDFVYVIKPGKHTLWMKNIQTGHIISPEDLRCYSFEADLRPDFDYILDEDRKEHIAMLKIESSGVVVATGRKVDEKAAYTNDCKW